MPDSVISTGRLCLAYYFNFGNTMSVEFNDLEAELSILNALMLLGEVAFQFQQQASKRISITLYLFKDIIVKFQDLVKIR